jgi:hypothetical protein
MSGLRHDGVFGPNTHPVTDCDRGETGGQSYAVCRGGGVSAREGGAGWYIATIGGMPGGVAASARGAEDATVSAGAAQVIVLRQSLACSSCELSE